jgi:choline kinase
VNTNYVLLAAGRGTRIADFSCGMPKSLLEIRQRPALGHILEALVLPQPKEVDVVVVTGHQASIVEAFVSETSGGVARTVRNERYAEDTNILSTSLGVEALRRPEKGYMVIETDIYLEPAGWSYVVEQTKVAKSFWVTRGLYSRELVGGAVKVAEDRRVDKMVYAPVFQQDYVNWEKLLGVVFVAKTEVEMDRSLRQGVIREGISYYYMEPWLRRLSDLPCSALDVTGFNGGSFNTCLDFKKLHEIADDSREGVV